MDLLSRGHRGRSGRTGYHGDAPVISRLAFDAELVHAIRIRGLTLTELARRANLSAATVSSALSGRPVNLTTALRLTRVVSAAPVVPELERWGRAPHLRPTPVEFPSAAVDARSAGTAGCTQADDDQLPLPFDRSVRRPGSEIPSRGRDVPVAEVLALRVETGARRRANRARAARAR